MLSLRCAAMLQSATIKKGRNLGIRDSQGLRHLLLHWADANDVRNFSNDPSVLLNILYILKSICAYGNFGTHLCGAGLNSE